MVSVAWQYCIYLHVYLLEWSKEQLLEAWMSDPVETCEKAGVQMPTVLSVDNLDDTLSPTTHDKGESEECGICFMQIESKTMMPCDHMFCHECWQQ